MTIKQILARHKSIVLAFSGGKDSLACLYLLRPYWDQIMVLWVNTGAAFPETIKQMEGIRKMVPHFAEVKSDQPGHVAMYGPPSDVVPMWATPLGRMIGEVSSHKVQTPFSCCGENIWIPARNAAQQLGATLIIRGQRNAEKRKGPIRDGMIDEDGIEYLLPLEDWTRDEVVTYLRDKDVPLPEHYRYFDSSLDCWSCTAYLDENRGKFDYMRERHPDLYEKTRQSLCDIVQAVREELSIAVELTTVADKLAA